MLRPGHWLGPSVAALVLLASAVHAERLPITTYSTADGLPHYVVNRIVIDSRGFVWFGTREGLSRFDGYGFTTYRVEHGLPSANITDIIEAPDGIYWIGTTAGLARFNPAGRANRSNAPDIKDVRHDSAVEAMFTVYLPENDRRAPSVTALARDPSGTIWVGTENGLYVMRPEERPRRLVAVDVGSSAHVESRSVTALLIDRGGALWIASNLGIHVRLPDGHIVGPTERLPPIGVESFFEDADGRVWAGTRTAGLWRLARAGVDPPRVVRVYGAHDGVPSHWVNQIFQSADKRLWAASTRGLFQFTPANDLGDLHVRVYAESGGLPNDEVRTIAEDRSGNLWIGTAGGAAKLSRTGFTRFGQADGLSWGMGLIETRAGEVALLGDDVTKIWGLQCFNGDGFHTVRPMGAHGGQGWGWNQVMLEDHLGDWWIGAREGVFRYSQPGNCSALPRATPTAHYDRRNGLAADVIIRIFEDSRGDVWMASVGEGARPNGLSRWVRATNTVESFDTTSKLPSLDRDYVSALTEDRAGNVWVGLTLGGLARYSGNRFTQFTPSDGVPAGQVRDLTLDTHGRLWAASYRSGLCRIDDPTAAHPTFRTYTTADGLSGNETHAVVAADSRIYVGTAHGIDRLDAETGELTHYTTSDGLPLGEMNAGIRDRRGALWFAYTWDVVRLEPERPRSPVPPLVLITGLQVDGQRQPISEIGQVNASRIELPSRTNAVRIDFVALELGAGIVAPYQYKLEGADDTWSPPSNERSVNYANLSPGHYRFLVQARNADGVPSHTPASVAFTIVPPLWQRPWFTAVAAVFVAVVAYALYRYRVASLVEIARIRTGIATDLHDDIGTNLTRIAVLGEVARQQGGRGDAMASITGIARESVATMSDIVWAIDPARDRLLDLVRKMREHAEEVFALGDVVLTFTAPKESEQQRLAVDCRRDVFLIFKEVVNNAARHAHGAHVRIEVQADRRRLWLQVADDGRGFRPGEDTDGHGITSIRRRALRLGAQLDVDARPGHGTTVTLVLPFEVKRAWHRVLPTQWSR